MALAISTISAITWAASMVRFWVVVQCVGQHLENFRPATMLLRLPTV
ncbi:MAG: hypothetical protein R2734_15140 [Nocardioides sp.]